MRTRKPRGRDWSVAVGLLVLGLATIGLDCFNRLYGTTPEAELTLVEGRPGDASLSRVSGSNGASTDYLRFRVGGFRTIYASDLPGYPEVASAVERGGPVRIWVSTRRETVFLRAGWVPLYRMESGGKPIVTYDEVVASKAAERGPLLLGGAFLTAFGVWALCTCLRDSLEHAEQQDESADRLV